MSANTSSTKTVQYAEPHLDRMRQILKAHPEVTKLIGNRPITAVYLVGVVLFQIAVAALLKDSSIWMVLVVSYIVGALANHALVIMIHEATHNLLFKTSNANRWMGIIANLPVIFPSAIGFRNFHMLHHRYQGDLELDADLAGPREAAWVGNSPLRKSLWLFFFWYVEGVIRPARLKTVRLMDGWVVTNVIVELAFLALTVMTLGWMSFAYFAFSSIFCIGLHPVGARWIQEHYTVVPNQETFSYYGPLNKTCFNVGYHNEHHDFMGVPWMNLPKLKAMAPEFYDSLYSHQSWTKLLLRFLFDRNLTLNSRVTRPGQAELRRMATLKTGKFHGEGVMKQAQADGMVVSEV